MTDHDRLGQLEWSSIGRSRTGAAVTLGAGLIAVTLFWAWAIHAAIDAATARPAACQALSAAECVALAQDGGW